MSALQSQVGGSHYKDFAIQPGVFCQQNGLRFFESSAIKYITRHRLKGQGRQDLEKAKHFIEMLLELEYPEENPFVRQYWTDGDVIRSKPNGMVEMFCRLGTGSRWVEQDYWPQPVDERTFRPISEAEARKLVEQAGGVW